jgi:hypothetical protein
MSEAVFPLHVSVALDRLTVPRLPAGFADRLAARLASGDLPEEHNSELPALRRPVGTTGWRRSGRILFVAATFGLATATAAAAGVFGDPVYIPVVSQALAKAQIVEMPTEKPLAEKQAMTEKQRAAPVPLPITPDVSGKDAVLALITELRDDSAYRDLPRRERLDRFKVEIDQLLADGTAQKADVKAAWAQLATERQAIDKARLEQGLPIRAPRIIEAKQRAKPLTPEQKEKVRDAVSQLTNEQRAELQMLRQRRRGATLQERRAVQSEIRAFWQRVRVKPSAEAATSETP